MKLRLLFAASMLAAALAGCGKDAAVEKAPQPPIAPFAHKQTTGDAVTSLSIDRRIGQWRALHQRLYRQGVNELRKFAADAVTSRAESRSADYQPPVYERELKWTVAAANPRLASLRQAWYEGTGGAHPNHGYETLLWDVARGAPVTRDMLFKPAGPADNPINARLCQGVREARAAKGVEYGPADEQTWPCPNWRDADFELAPSNTPGRFGAVTFLFDPYAIGSYAEGEYEITLPQSAFTEVIAPQWAAEFAGAPMPPAKR